MSGAYTGKRPARLSRATLPSLPAEVAPPLDVGALRPGIVHLGVGAFHRAHQAVYTQEAIARAGGDWGICGATQRSAAVRDRLMPQDGLYSVLVRGPAGASLHVMGVLRDVIDGAAAPEAVVQRIAAPATHVVTVTVTEKGYRHHPASGRLRWDDAELAADLAGRPPRTTVGQVARGLAARRRADAGPLSVVCCDNLADNGALLGSLVRQFAQRLPEGERLRDWIEANARFPSTMVDRIVPAATRADREQAAEILGVWDEGLVTAEPFSQWVIEDAFAGPRPSWEAAGALMTADVRPYERAKMRMLNGSHSTIAALGQLAGYEFVSDVMAADSAIAAVVVRQMSDDVVPTLQPAAGLDLERYQADLLERFSNPAVRHRLAQIAMDGSHKLPQRHIAIIAERRRAGAHPVATLLGVAAWMRVIVDRRADDGTPIAVDDPLAERVAQRVPAGMGATATVDAMLSLSEVFSPEVAEDAAVRDTLVEHLQRLRRDGAQAAARRVATAG